MQPALALEFFSKCNPQDDPACRERVILSYRMMLEFYGFTLLSTETGALERSNDFEERFSNLSRNSHNFLRISRILKSLGELGFERFKVRFLFFSEIS